MLDLEARLKIDMQAPGQVARLPQWISLVGFHLALALFACLTPFPTFAEETVQGVHIALGQSRDLLVAVESACDQTARDNIRNRFGIERTSVKVLPNAGELGAVSIYGATTHVFFFGKSPSGYAIIEISSAVGPRSDKICGRSLVFGPTEKLRKVGSSFPGGDGIRQLSGEQQHYIQDIYKRCKSKERRSDGYFAGGEFEVEQGSGGVMSTFRFNCEAAAENNAAALDIVFRSSTIRVVAVFDRLYVSEVAKR